MTWIDTIQIALLLIAFLVCMGYRMEYKLYKKEAERYQEWYYESDRRFIDLHGKYVDSLTNTMIRNSRQLQHARSKIKQLTKQLHA